MHPKITQRKEGRLWHLEDMGLSKVAAMSLAEHLRKTEDKRARIHKTQGGYQVWWAKY